MLTGAASLGGGVDAHGDKGASTGSTEDIANDIGALGVPVDNDVGARALGVEGSDLRDAVAGTFSDLGAIVAAQSHVVLNVDVVAGLALGGGLTARGLDEGECATVVIWSIITPRHEDDYIGAGCVELRGNDSCLGRGEGGEGAEGDGVADDGRHD